MDEAREEQEQAESARAEVFGPQLIAPAPDPVGPRRSRAALAASGGGTGSPQDPGLALLGGGLAVLVGAALTAVLGWAALLGFLALVQVVFARAWAAYLEVPAERLVAGAVVVVAAVADLGLVVVRLDEDSDIGAGELAPLLPALGVTFLVAVLAQLVRRGERDGTLAGLVASTTGGVVAVGLAVWVPLEGSPAGAGWVVAGLAAVGLAGVVLGAVGWARQRRVPAPALFLPVLLALLAGPFYVAGRVVAG